jgi:hypothetical protein
LEQERGPLSSKVTRPPTESSTSASTRGPFDWMGPEPSLRGAAPSLGPAPRPHRRHTPQGRHDRGGDTALGTASTARARYMLRVDAPPRQAPPAWTRGTA